MIVNNFSILYFVIVVLVATSECEGKADNNEKIAFFLAKYEITEITEVPLRSQRSELIDSGNAEKSFKITAFGSTFIVDLSIYYPRDDTRIEYVSKLSNNTNSFLSTELVLQQGYVRNVNNSLVLGIYSDRKLFRGYIITDEVFCIEPYESNAVIVYRFKDVIAPGCTKKSDNEDLDCSDTRYFAPWYAHRAPPVQPLLPRYHLFYDKYLNFYRRLQARKTAAKKEDGKEKDSSTSKHHDSKSKDHHKSDKKDEKKKKSDQKSEVKLYDSKGNQSIGEDFDYRSTTEYPVMIETRDSYEKIKSIKHNNKKYKPNQKKKKKEEEEEDDDDDDDDDDEDEEDIVLNFLKNDDSFPVPKNNMAQKKTDKKEETWNWESNLEALKEDRTVSLECNVQVIVSPSLLKKFNGDSDLLIGDILTQFTLLNKIFLKLPITRRGKPAKFFFHVETITIHGDQVYSPFGGERVNLETFTKANRDIQTYCLSIGIANQYLRSGEFFDGYTPEGKGGVCTRNGNTLLASHGNEHTPAPMALYFAALMRGLTRAVGALDKDDDCEEGSFPNPMQVLQDYLLTEEIKPSSGFSIFTKCNVKEIEKVLNLRACFYTVSQPLCGNGVLDPGEECDCGPIAKCKMHDSCCNTPHLYEDPEQSEINEGSAHKSCTLVKTAKCSFLQPCCTACEIGTNQTDCISGPFDCDVSTCDGKSASCPTGVEASNGMICSTNKTLSEPMVCKDAKCDQQLCSSFELQPCSCAAGTERDCLYCCLKDGKCQAAGKDLNLFSNRHYHLPDDTECMGGICQSGKCQILNGEQQILNKPTESSYSYNEFSTMNIIIGSICSISVLLLLNH